MDEMTQQNAALVEEAAAAAESLREQAGKLSEAVSVFRVEGLGGGSPGGARMASTPARDVTPLKPKSRPSDKSVSPSTARPKKVASGGGADEWEEF
ncbi:MAG: hypothetical protein B7Y26_13170 [Hydrogenophilales bacterium 16-64-46]|nr:MAG: hypothetical protein B7Z32_12720 [Hydrogenophilales bacterium 12-64-13]OYZ04131.1 MAG: hypothetical protein B7Y26_13170 [Hydrogenophilales bacterium 16-64-46]OZA36933.1 MAG: hypothetical protein B7X87_12725 [Hydrogenophilales bacterium 17-64-34]